MGVLCGKGGVRKLITKFTPCAGGIKNRSALRFEGVHRDVPTNQNRQHLICKDCFGSTEQLQRKRTIFDLPRPTRFRLTEVDSSGDAKRRRSSEVRQQQGLNVGQRLAGVLETLLSRPMTTGLIEVRILL